MQTAAFTLHCEVRELENDVLIEHLAVRPRP